MSLQTTNIYGRISISDDAVAIIASQAAAECYGVVELVSRRLSDNLAQLFNKQTYGKGVKVATVDNKVYIDIFAVLKLGVNVEAVRESMLKAVKYSVERYTGMRVKLVTVNIVGVRV
jgi:Uncharacterized protein conserved in bacteria